MRNPKYPNDVGVAWKKESEHGKYISVALDLEALLELTGGAVDTVNLSMSPIISDHPKAPDFRIKYSPARGTGTSAPTSTRRDPVPDDDDIPF